MTLSAEPGNSYRVGVGDLLEVRVLGEKEFSGEFRILTDGTIDYPHLRRIAVEGKTTEELGKLITEKLKDGYLVEPQVNVDVKDYQSQKVLVLGAVKTPGTYVLREETKILDILSRAGGIDPSGGKKILLIRGAKPKEEAKPSETPSAMGKDVGEPMIVDYFRLIQKGDFSQNVVLQDGDVINVPKANEVFVLGNVARPGPVPYEENMMILQAVTLAGGTTPTASPRSTYILRKGDKKEDKINVRLDKIIENKEKNVSLEPNDVIVVPESFF